VSACAQCGADTYQPGPGGCCEPPVAPGTQPRHRINLLTAETRSSGPVYRVGNHLTFVTPLLSNGTWCECAVYTVTAQGPVYYRLSKVRPVVRYKEN